MFVCKEIFLLVCALPQNLKLPEGAEEPPAPPELTTARLWIIPLILILFYMHILAVSVTGSGVKFN